MPASTFHVRVLGVQTLTSLDNAWGEHDYAALLDACGIDGIDDLPPTELEEMCLLALQDLGPVGAAKVTLTHRLGDRLRRGQIEPLAIDLTEDRQWEHHADMMLHEALFEVGSLLWRALPGAFPKPDAVRVELGIQPNDRSAARSLEAGVDETLLVRLVADGLPKDSILHRLFADELERGAFEEATAIVWTFAATHEETGMRVQIIGSNAWIGSLRSAGEWTSDATRGTDTDGHE